MTDECVDCGGPLNAKPEAPEPPVYDPVYELAKLVAAAFSDPMLFGAREGLRVSLGVGAGTSVALIEMRIREAVASSRAIAFDLTDLDVLHVLTTALEDYEAKERDMAALEDAGESRKRWANLARVMRKAAETAAG